VIILHIIYDIPFITFVYLLSCPLSFSLADSLMILFRLLSILAAWSLESLELLASGCSARGKWVLRGTKFEEQQAELPAKGAAGSGGVACRGRFFLLRWRNEFLSLRKMFADIFSLFERGINNYSAIFTSKVDSFTNLQTT